MLQSWGMRSRPKQGQPSATEKQHASPKKGAGAAKKAPEAPMTPTPTPKPPKQVFEGSGKPKIISTPLPARKLSIIAVLVTLACTIFYVIIDQKGEAIGRFLGGGDLLSKTASVPPPSESLVNQPKSPYAYGFVLTNCTDSQDDSCVGPLLNLIVAAYTLRSSHMNRVVYIHMSSQTSATRIFPAYELWLRKVHYRIHYVKYLTSNATMTTPGVDNSAVAAHVLERFRVLELTDYKRVMFIDPRRVLPLCNMLYMFDFSAKGAFNDLVLVAGVTAPVLSSLFVVTPQDGEFELVVDIVRQYRERHPSDENQPSFDRSQGWGQPFTEKDIWKSWRKSGNAWNFGLADRDQGLLYHWARYVRMNYTRLTRGQYISWTEIAESEKSAWSKRTKGEVFSSSQAYKEKTGTRYIARTAMSAYARGFGCAAPLIGRDRRKTKSYPYRDYMDFEIIGKAPWLTPITAHNMTRSNPKNTKSPMEFWRLALLEANATWKLGLPSTIVISSVPSSEGTSILSSKVPLPEPSLGREEAQEIPVDEGLSWGVKLSGPTLPSVNLSHVTQIFAVENRSPFEL